MLSSAYDIAVVVAAHARERAGGPLRVADGEFIASRQGVVLDQQTADVVACAICSWQLVEFLVGDARCDGKILEEGRDVSLPDPGHSAVGPLHRLQCRGHRDQLGGHHTGVGVGEQLVDKSCELARPASAAAVELVLGAAGLAVEVELDARAASAGRLPVDTAREHALVATHAGATCALGLLVAVAAHAAVWPVRDDLVVLTAAAAGDGPLVGIARLAWPSHLRRPGRS